MWSLCCQSPEDPYWHRKCVGSAGHERVEEPVCHGGDLHTSQTLVNNHLCINDSCICQPIKRTRSCPIKQTYQVSFFLVRYQNICWHPESCARKKCYTKLEWGIKYDIRIKIHQHYKEQSNPKSAGPGFRPWTWMCTCNLSVWRHLIYYHINADFDKASLAAQSQSLKWLMLKYEQKCPIHKRLITEAASFAPVLVFRFCKPILQSAEGMRSLKGIWKNCRGRAGARVTWVYVWLSSELWLVWQRSVLSSAGTECSALQLHRARQTTACLFKCPKSYCKSKSTLSFTDQRHPIMLDVLWLEDEQQRWTWTVTSRRLIVKSFITIDRCC